MSDGHYDIANELSSKITTGFLLNFIYLLLLKNLQFRLGMFRSDMFRFRLGMFKEALKIIFCDILLKLWLIMLIALCTTVTVS